MPSNTTRLFYAHAQFYFPHAWQIQIIFSGRHGNTINYKFHGARRIATMKYYAVPRARTCHSSMVCIRDTRTSCPHAQFCRTTAPPKPNVIFSYRYYTRQCQNNKTLSCATQIKNHLTVVSISPSTLRHARAQICTYSNWASLVFVYKFF